MMDSGLGGKTAIITGANSGIGAATARALAAEGVRVVITYLRLDPAGQAEHPSTPPLYWQQREKWTPKTGQWLKCNFCLNLNT